MATMYSILLGLLLNALCSSEGYGSGFLNDSKLLLDNVFYSLYQGRDFHFFLDEKTKQKNQGLVARLNCLLISGNKTNSLRSDKSDCLSEIIGNSLRLAQPRPWDDLLAYGVKGRKATIYRNSHFAIGQDSQSRRETGGQETLGTAYVALRSLDEHRVNSLDLCGTFYQGKVPRQSANEDKRNLIITIASAELGIKEATGNNDGPRVEQYLRYTNLGPGYEWCASFVSWVYGQAGFSAPRNPWSPALFPKARAVKESQVQPADLFAIYSATAKRIHHVGLIRNKQGQYIVTIEGNSNNRVESRRRHVKTVYSYANWVERS